MASFFEEASENPMEEPSDLEARKEELRRKIARIQSYEDGVPVPGEYERLNAELFRLEGGAF